MLFDENVREPNRRIIKGRPLSHNTRAFIKLFMFVDTSIKAKRLRAVATHKAGQSFCKARALSLRNLSDRRQLCFRSSSSEDHCTTPSRDRLPDLEYSSE